MNDIIVRPKNKKQSDELLKLLQQMKIKFDIFDAEREDQGLLGAMLETEEEKPKPIAELYDAMGWK